MTISGLKPVIAILFRITTQIVTVLCQLLYMPVRVSMTQQVFMGKPCKFVRPYQDVALARVVAYGRDLQKWARM